MSFKSVQDWLAYQEQVHHQAIELGLDRVRQVWLQLNDQPFDCPVITVAGTNGKGSTIAILSSIYQQQGYRVASYTSPHLDSYNERIKINNQPIDDDSLISAFEAVEHARTAFDSPVTLTYFEFGTLAALCYFIQQSPDIILLEVGLGGRLDAVNIIDSEVGIITQVGLDHMEYLGDSVEQIGREKAGIARSGKPLIIGQRNDPASLLATVQQHGAIPYIAGKDYEYDTGEDGAWQWSMADRQYCLPGPALAGRHQYSNAAAALCAIQLLQSRLRVDDKQIAKGLQLVDLAGRLQCISEDPLVIVDVAHNADAASALSYYLRDPGFEGRTHLVLAMQANREPSDFIRPLSDLVDQWWLTGFEAMACHPPEVLLSALLEIVPDTAHMQCCSVAKAVKMATESADIGDRIIVTGSFYTLAELNRH